MVLHRHQDVGYLVYRAIVLINGKLNLNLTSCCFPRSYFFCFSLSLPLCQEFRRSGVDLSQSVVATCGSGVTAAIIALAAHTLHTSLPVYDVSNCLWLSSDNMFVSSYCILRLWYEMVVKWTRFCVPIYHLAVCAIRIR